MRRRTSIVSPIDTINTLVEMLIQSDSTVEDGEICWVRSEQTLYVYRINSGLVADNITIVGSLYGTGVWVRLDVGLGGASPAFYARGIGTANIANLAAASTGPYDGITYAEGQVIFLAAQTSPTQNGPYVFTGVSGGVGKLVRPAWWASGATLKTGIVVQVAADGTVFGNTQWQVMTATASGAFVVDISDPQVYPIRVLGQTQLVNGTFTISGIPIRSTSKTNITLTRVVGAGAGLANTVEYCPTVANANGITAGVIGTGQIVVQACVAAGTINATDTSTLNWTIENGRA
jgi:hypothetical protein